MIYCGKEKAELALISNDRHNSAPLILLTKYLEEVCKQIEFEGFPITKGVSGDNIEDVLKLSKEYNIAIEPKADQKPENTYSSGVIHVETRMTSFDHCTLRGGSEYMRIKDKDLAMATHPKFPDGIVYIPLGDPNIGCFIFKMTPNVDIENIKSFNDFARDIIDVSLSLSSDTGSRHV